MDCRLNMRQLNGSSGTKHVDGILTHTWYSQTAMTVDADLRFPKETFDYICDLVHIAVSE